MMDRFEKWAKYIMQHGDIILEKKKHRNMLIRRVSFSCASAFAAVIIAFFAWKSAPPKIEIPSDNIISENTTTITSTYIQSTSEKITTVVSTSNNKTSPTTIQFNDSTTSNCQTHIATTIVFSNVVCNETMPITDSQLVTASSTSATTSTVNTSTPILEDEIVKECKILYSNEEIINIEGYKAFASKSYKSYNNIIASTTSSESTTTQTTVLSSPITTTSILIDEKELALNKLAEKEKRMVGKFERERAIILGELSPDAARITLEDVIRIIDESDSFRDIRFKLNEIQPYSDYSGGSGFTFVEYWLDDKGTQKIMLVLERQSIVFIRFKEVENIY